MRSKFAIFALFTLALLSWGLYQALVGAPTEATMGPVQRIFYYHVPNAWVMELCFPLNFLASIIYLITRKPAVDAFAVATAEVGVVFCTVVLLTGPIWARPVWGIWWTWDARLTSTLVLWLIYVGYLMLRKLSTGGPNPGARGGIRDLRLPRRRLRVHGDPLVPHATSATGFWRRSELRHRSAHDACFPHQHAGFHLLRSDAGVDSLHAGAHAPESR